MTIHDSNMPFYSLPYSYYAVHRNHTVEPQPQAIWRDSKTILDLTFDPLDRHGIVHVQFRALWVSSYRWLHACCLQAAVAVAAPTATLHRQLEAIALVADDMWLPLPLVLT